MKPLSSAASDARRTPHAPGGHAGRLPWTWLAALAGLALVIDGTLALRVMGEGDGAEFALTLALAGVPHPSGYPLYILFGHAFVRALHALGVDWPLAANLWSATGAAVATLLTATLADRLIPAAARLSRTGRLATIVAASLALFANPVFIRAATQAEVHSWHVAWVAGSGLAALAAWRALAGREPLAASRLRAFAFGWGLLTGAGLAHHLTAIFFIVPLGLLLVLAARRARRLDAPVVLTFVAGVALPLLSFCFVAWRAVHPAPFQWPALEPGWSGAFAHATGAVYRTFVGGFAPSPAEQQLLFGAVAPVIIPGLLAALTVAWRARREADAAPLAALLAAAVLQSAFALRYAVIDPSSYFLPVMVVSVVALARLGADLTERLTSPALGRIFALAAMSIVSFAWVGSEADHARQIAGVDAQVREAFRALPFDRGVVIWHSDSYVRLRAQQLLDGEQPGIVVIDPAMLTWAPERRAQTRALGFDPLAGMRLESDADLAGVAGNIARQTPLPVVDFAQWWERSRGFPPTGAHR